MRRNVDMLHGSLYKSILTYAIPIILTNFLQLMFNAADLIVVGQYCGSIAVAAVGATTSITALLVNLFIGLSTGASILVAQGLGGQDSEKVHRVVHTALPTALVCGGILSAIGILYAEEMLRYMDTPGDVLPLATVYMRVYFAGLVFSMVYNFCASILRAAGDTKTPLYFLTISGVANVALNILFVTVFNLNVAGVALATMISQAISAIMVVTVLCRRTDSCRLEMKKIRFYKKPLLEMIRFGLPAGIQSSLFSISNVIIQSSMNSFQSGAILSGHSAAGNIEGFIYGIMTGFTNTAVNFIGQNAGAHNYKRIKKIIWICNAYCTVILIVISQIVFFFSRELLSIYITDSVEAIEYGRLRMVYIMLFLFVGGLMNITSDSLRGLGCSFLPMFTSIIGICGFRLVWIYTIFQIPKYHTMDCLYISYPITWGITFLFHLITFIIIFKKKSRQYETLKLQTGETA